MTILERFYKGDLRALSKIVSHVENRGERYRELLGRLYEKAGKAVRLGITGPPGAGKSTLVNCLSHRLLEKGNKVGVVAVDPTSPFTGGALLGDRVRLKAFPPDGSFYFRSMATRGATGGLASATDNVTVVYDAYGFDFTLIETVGVGQVELDVMDTCDAVAVVVVPESGDSVQTMKAGLMEIADIFCVNKADRPGADRLAMEIKQMLQVRKKVEAEWQIPVLKTIATEASAADELLTCFEEYLTFMRGNGRFETRRRRQIIKKIRAILANRFQRDVIEQLGDDEAFEEIVASILSRQANPYEVSDELYDRFTTGS
jgi:LAO/AO transport system kinase